MKEIDIENKFYPKLLRNIINPPKTLYLLGNENNLRKKSLSIIGSRNASDYGRKNARIFAKGIAMQGINIVSGMAEGIDSEAHLGAMEVEGSTIAVLGSGFNVRGVESNESGHGAFFDAAYGVSEELGGFAQLWLVVAGYGADETYRIFFGLGVVGYVAAEECRECTYKQSLYFRTLDVGQHEGACRCQKAVCRRLFVHAAYYAQTVEPDSVHEFLAQVLGKLLFENITYENFAQYGS